jgi:hypothetical protein
VKKFATDSLSEDVTEVRKEEGGRGKREEKRLIPHYQFPITH